VSRPLEGRHALVTGAARGNGAAIAEGLAAAGAHVLLVDIDGAGARQTAEAIVARGGRADAATLDVCDADACAALAEKGRRERPLDILVNNAGILVRATLDTESGRTDWERTLSVNLQGTYNVTMAFLDELKARRGCIVSIASVNAYAAPRGSGAYNVSKAALVQFTRSLASELAADGVRVNAIAPGIIATDMTVSTRSEPGRLEAYLRHVPMQRVGEPRELAGPVVFLCSDAASYVTGAVLPVDGGFLVV